jgi:hypothetical protein
MDKEAENMLKFLNRRDHVGEEEGTEMLISSAHLMQLPPKPQK